MSDTINNLFEIVVIWWIHLRDICSVRLKKTFLSYNSFGQIDKWLYYTCHSRSSVL